MINTTLGKINQTFITVENQLTNEIESYLDQKYDLDKPYIIISILDTIYDLPEQYTNIKLVELIEEYVHEPQY